MSLSNFFDKKPGLSFAISAAIILFIGVAIFLFSKGDPANPHSITGWQALALQNASFWIWAVIISAGIGVLLFFITKYLKAGGDSRSFGSWMIGIACLLFIIWHKGCETKANDGVGAPKERKNAPVADPNRVPAEDLLPKKK